MLMVTELWKYINLLICRKCLGNSNCAKYLQKKKIILNFRKTFFILKVHWLKTFEYLNIIPLEEGSVHQLFMTLIIYVPLGW